MNKPSAREIRAMRARYSPVRATLYQVWSCGVVVFENTSYGLCQWYVQQNNIKSKPKTKK